MKAKEKRLKLPHNERYLLIRRFHKCFAAKSHNGVSKRNIFCWFSGDSSELWPVMTYSIHPFGSHDSLHLSHPIANATRSNVLRKSAACSCSCILSECSGTFLTILVCGFCWLLLNSVGLSALLGGDDAYCCRHNCFEHHTYEMHKATPTDMEDFPITDIVPCPSMTQLCGLHNYSPTQRRDLEHLSSFATLPSAVLLGGAGCRRYSSRIYIFSRRSE